MHIANASIIAASFHFAGLYALWTWRQDTTRWLFLALGAAALLASGAVVAWAHVHMAARALLSYIGVFGVLAVLALRIQDGANFSRYDLIGMILLFGGALLVGIGPLMARR